MTIKSAMLLAALCGVTLQVGTVSAADLIIEEIDPVPIIGFDWDRFYGGVYVGYGIANVEISNDFGVAFFNGNLDISGLLGGVTVGKNFRSDNEIVFGIEGDFGFANMRGSLVPPIIDPATYGQYSAKIDRTATLRARLGVLADDDEKVLIYLTGGIAGAHASATAQYGSFNPSFSNSKWLVGYTVGGGVEVALSEKITFKTEYLYTDLRGQVGVGLSAINNVNFDFKSTHQIRAGLNFHF